MDLLKILRSVEELLYEVMSWLVFYPRTLWLTLRHPLRTMRYSDSEQHDQPDQQYLETLSPPLFLVLSIILSHGIEVVAGLKTPEMHAALAAGIVSSDQNLMIFRALMFSTHPLLFAVVFLWLGGRRLDRDTLRPPFFAQCYLSGATSILVGLGSTGIRYPSNFWTAVGVALIVATTVWYLAIQRRWLMRVEGMTRWRAFGWAVGTYVLATALVVGAAAVLD
ncbi:hypothetical protein [Brevundimonas sp. Root1423]|uniref:hypothetical protein n=1 Tax=Brevundimonas sp. Root1423 TaxID=1736462 RepID=UPI0007009CDE|nr:hypothetical protein [Brevundimonas sp. Root1423]KQY91288.1 hypothetical protein ASD25_19190 [Brevundimonas sp. Root1423]